MLHYRYKNGEEIDFSYQTGFNKAENELIFEVQPNDNEAVYRFVSVVFMQNDIDNLCMVNVRLTNHDSLAFFEKKYFSCIDNTNRQCFK